MPKPDLDLLRLDIRYRKEITYIAEHIILDLSSLHRFARQRSLEDLLTSILSVFISNQKSTLQTRIRESAVMNENDC